MKAKGNQAMLEPGASRIDPKLRELVAEASRALARLDADRLEELALSCKALNSERTDCGSMDRNRRAALATEAKAAAGDMAVFARVIEATRANLQVMHRLRDLRDARLGYGEVQSPGWRPAESGHGDN